MKTDNRGGSGKQMKSLSGNAKRPPKLKGKVANDVHESGARSSVMPAPQGDTNYTKGKRP